MSKTVVFENDNFGMVKASIIQELGAWGAIQLEFNIYEDIDDNVAMKVNTCAFVKSDHLIDPYYDTDKEVVVIPLGHDVKLRKQGRYSNAFHNVLLEFKELADNYEDRGVRTWGVPKITPEIVRGSY